MTAAGIDVGKASQNLAVDGRSEVARYPNTAAGIAKIVRRLQMLKATRIVGKPPGVMKNRCWTPAVMPDCGLRG